MKHLAIIITLSLTFPYLCQAQDPCAGKKYCFVYINRCDTTMPCADNPYTENTDKGVPMHWLHGSTIHFCGTSLGDGCFVDQACVEQCVEAAYQKWLSFCAAGTLNVAVDWTGPNPCCIPIVYWNDANEYGPGTARVAAETNPVYECYWGTLVCAFDLTNPNHHMWIHINSTAANRAIFQNVCPCPSANSCPIPHGKTAVNICSVLAHEIGHVFGIQHTVERNPKTGKDGSNCGNFSDDDLMAWAGKQTISCSPPNWTTNDACSFKKLYCYGYSSVKPETSSGPFFDPDLEAFPNPTTGMLTVQYTSNIVGMVTVEIVDDLGRQLLSNIFREVPERSTHTIDLSSLANGHYILRILGADFRASRLIRLKIK